MSVWQRKENSVNKILKFMNNWGKSNLYHVSLKKLCYFRKIRRLTCPYGKDVYPYKKITDSIDENV